MESCCYCGYFGSTNSRFMPKSSNRFLRYGLLFCCAVGLLLVRALETRLFYDPLHDYFKSDYLTASLPEFDTVRLTVGMALRFVVNSGSSLLMIRLLFPKQKITWLLLLYVALFLLLIASFVLVLRFWPENRFAIFYVRRFLIQPLFLLLFVPALYYQQSVRLKKS
ncbi:MAG: exosortase F system-associated protein [Chitinophagaceae bacterium]|nr:MAG: exosortase F system-associated protein [Chitinophagaceae bacterium]